MIRRGLFAFLVLGILIFSSVSFVFAQEPGAGFSALNFINVYISDVKGKVYDPNSPSQSKLTDLWSKCRDSCSELYDARYGPDGSTITRHADYQKYETCVHRCNVRQEKAKILPELALCEKIKNEAQNKKFDVLIGYITESLKAYLSEPLPGITVEDYKITPYELYFYRNVVTHDYSLISEETFKTYLATVGLPEDGTLGYQGGEVDPTSSFNYDLYRQKLMDEINEKVSECESQLKEFTGDVRNAGGSGQISKDEGVDLCEPCEKEVGAAREDCYYECQKPASSSAENELTETIVPKPTDQETSENGNYEKGGTLKEWKERLQSKTGPDSAPSKTAAECDALRNQKIAECSKNGGWITNYMMEITDFRTDEHYEFQDTKNGGCPAASPTGEEYPYAKARDIDTANLDSQAEAGKSEYQVVCSVLCSSWSCGAPAGTAAGGIESLKGKVEVRQPDGSWKKAGSGAAIHLNDDIRTGKDGKAVIKLADDTVFTLGHDSQFTVGDSKTESKLNFGRLKAKIKCFIKTVDCYPVRFTNAVAAVRGTEYVAIADQSSNTTTILVNEGTVSLTETKTGSTQNVSAGNSGVVDNSGIKVKSISDAEWKNAAGEFDSGKNQWAIYLGFLGVLLAIGLLVYKKMKNKKASKTVKKQSVEHKKSEKISRETKKWGVASLILAILGILFFFLPYFGIILAILAVVFSIIQKKHNPTKIATAGLVIGIIGIVINIFVLIALTIK